MNIQVPAVSSRERISEVGDRLTPTERRLAEALIAEGEMEAAEFPTFATESGFKPAQTEFIDGKVFDGSKPNAYLEQFPIGLKGDEVVE